MADGAVATVKLPFRLNQGIHGWWVPGNNINDARGTDLMTPKAAYEIRMIGVLTLMFGFVFFDRNAMGNLAPFITASLHLTNGQIGALSSGLSICWAISGFADRYPVGCAGPSQVHPADHGRDLLGVLGDLRVWRPPSGCCWPRAC